VSAIDIQPEREPDLGFKTQWIQEYNNQKALLDCFAGHLVPQESLCFFYAKQVPFVEDAGLRRILIGVGRVADDLPAIIQAKTEVPDLLRAVRGLSAEQLRILHESAEEMKRDKSKKDK